MKYPLYCGMFFILVVWTTCHMTEANLQKCKFPLFLLNLSCSHNLDNKIAQTKQKPMKTIVQATVEGPAKKKRKTNHGCKILTPEANATSFEHEILSP